MHKPVACEVSAAGPHHIACFAGDLHSSEQGVWPADMEAHGRWIAVVVHGRVCHRARGSFTRHETESHTCRPRPARESASWPMSPSYIVTMTSSKMKAARRNIWSSLDLGADSGFVCGMHACGRGQREGSGWDKTLPSSREMLAHMSGVW